MCVQQRVIRDTIYQLNGTLQDAKPLLWDHVLHCVEALRQALACFSDPTLIPYGIEWPGIPNGQMHVCQNRHALRRWSTQFQHDQPKFATSQSTPHTKEWLQRHEVRQSH